MGSIGKKATRGEDRPHRVFLTGFMGTGKSTVGPLLAEKLGWEFRDTDSWIEKMTGCSASEWIQKKGEQEFRRIEFRAIHEIVRSPQLVISLGGGALTHPGVRDWIQERGWLVYLKTEYKTLEGRIKDNLINRPLALNSNGQFDSELLQSLYLKRASEYEKADFQIETASKAPSQIADELKLWILGELSR